MKWLDIKTLNTISFIPKVYPNFHVIHNKFSNLLSIHMGTNKLKGYTSIRKINLSLCVQHKNL